jgi:NADP-dependent 3-hydroxy acid dehydrogenase YdfG
MSSNFDEWNAILYDKVVFLTGAAGGVARYIAEACYVHGASVVLGDLDVNVINKIKDEIIAKTNIKEDRLLVVKLDVTDEKSIQRAIQTTLDKWETIHVLLNT